MQWLVDLVIAAIGIPPTFISREDPEADDFETADFTQDVFWHLLDLTSIIPVGTTCILIALKVESAGVDAILRFRQTNYTKTIGSDKVRSLVANVPMSQHLPIGIGADRLLEYKATAPWFTLIRFGVRGWWL